VLVALVGLVVAVQMELKAEILYLVLLLLLAVDMAVG
jgi:hypothetical protein